MFVFHIKGLSSQQWCATLCNFLSFFLSFFEKANFCFKLIKFSLCLANLCHVTDAVNSVLCSAGLQVPAAPVQVHLDSCVFSWESLVDDHSGRQVDLNWLKHKDIHTFERFMLKKKKNKAQMGYFDTLAHFPQISNTMHNCCSVSMHLNSKQPLFDIYFHIT